MRILEITFVPPDKMSGGGLGIYQSIKSLLSVGDVDYIGPKFDTTLFESSDKLNSLCILQAKKRSISRMIFKNISTSFYDDWENFVDKINWNNYDFVHIESSRYYFVVKTILKHNIPIIMRMHNIESDYGYNIYCKNKSLSNYIRYYSYHTNEKKVIRKVNSIIFLTINDIKRARKLYKVKENQIYLNPVCININKNCCREEKEFHNEKFSKFLMTGTLNYGPNVDGVIWFLDNVWTKNYNNDKFTLTIAGAHPNDKLKEIIANNANVTLIDTPDDMTEYFLSADCYIAPIFDGAGMKVKVAEALSYGLPVIGTTHAFIGYEEIEKGKYLANSADEFTENINKITTASIERNVIYNEFYSKLSMNRSIEFYNKLSREIISKKL